MSGPSQAASLNGHDMMWMKPFHPTDAIGCDFALYVNIPGYVDFAYAVFNLSMELD